MAFKIILGNPAITRFSWEIDTLLTNIRHTLGWDIPIVLLLTEDDMSVVRHFQGRYENVEVHHYRDDREDKSYPATTRPYLFWRYFSEDPSREKGSYFQVDSDIIFKEIPDLGTMSDKSTMYGSDCGGYMDYDYKRTRIKGEEIVDGLAEILCIDRKVIEKTPGAGAQFVYHNPTAQLWWHIWQDSDIIYRYLNSVGSDIQVWSSEMEAQLYNFVKFGWKVELSPELDFCRPTDDVRMWDQVKILHNAGVVGPSAAGLLFKGQYVDRTPFEEDLSWVRRDKAGKKYAEAVERVYNSGNQ